MALLTRQTLRGRASTRTFGRSASSVLAGEAREVAKAKKEFDVFLSHSYVDAAAILGLKITLERSGLSVYLDWVEDPQLDRGNADRVAAPQLNGKGASGSFAMPSNMDSRRL